MRKFIATLVIVTLLFSVIAGCKNKVENETTTSVVTTQIQTENETETEIPSTKEETTEKPVEYIKSEKLKIENEKYCFTVQKTNFEKYYSEELLMDITHLVPMLYGYDDYENWNGTPNEVINDALRCMQASRNNWFFERYNSDTVQWKAAYNEMQKNPYRITDDFVITDIESINNYLEDRFGSQVRKFKASDFDTYNEVKISDDSITEEFNLLSYRYTYLPECGLVACFMSETTGFGSRAAYIYDIQTVDGTYVVKAVSGSDNYPEKSDSFDDIQTSSLKMLNGYTEEYLRDFTMSVAYDDNGNLYMKSVKSKYILSENVKNNYKVATDGFSIEVRSRELFSKKDTVVEMIPDGAEIYVTDIGESVAWVITEDNYGYVEKEYLIPIE
ncbi:MAG: hypothetical protein IJE72_00345 [Clostridia bacterium]|nr:hypothetical protein [Clostridia bacterium]